MDTKNIKIKVENKVDLRRCKMISTIIFSFITGFIVGAVIVGSIAVDLGMKIGREEADDYKK